MPVFKDRGKSIPVGIYMLASCSIVTKAFDFCEKTKLNLFNTANGCDLFCNSQDKSFIQIS